MTAQARAVREFRRLHAQPEPLVLANAWDVVSARLVERTGGKAVATSSAGVAWALGFADGEQLPIERVLALARDLVNALRVPLSVDLERGYDHDPERVAELAAELARIGVAGVNLEDGGGEPELLAAKLSACRARLAHLGLDLFLNARADVFLHSAIPGPERAAEVVRRGLRYRAAGADGLFVPALFELAQIAQIASEVPLPLNVWPVPVRPDFADLFRIGVRRISVGPRVALAAWSAARDAMLALHGGAPATGGAPLSYSEVNAWPVRVGG
jgi:2-methylisocitrate lyase-like PEP mutase family enzyme